MAELLAEEEQEQERERKKQEKAAKKKKVLMSLPPGLCPCCFRSCCSRCCCCSFSLLTIDDIGMPHWCRLRRRAGLAAVAPISSRKSQHLALQPQAARAMLRTLPPALLMPLTAGSSCHWQQRQLRQLQQPGSRSQNFRLQR